MTGKQIIIEALNNKTTPRPAWLPFVGVHGGSLIGKKATEYLQSADLLVEGLLKAKELYKPDGLPIAFDLQLEAEVLGCNLEWADDGPPAVTSHPLLMMGDNKTLAELPGFDENAGRYPVVLEATRKMKQAVGDEIALYGLVCGPYTLCLHMMGNDIFLKMFDDPQGVKDTIAFCNEFIKKASEAYIKAGCDVIAVVDPMVSQISAEHFEEFVSEYVTDLFDHIRLYGGYSSLFVCGDATRNLDAMFRTSCDNISVDENISLEYMCELRDKYQKSIGGNMKLTTVLLLGKPDDAKIDALRCMDECGQTGFILAPGCDLPYSVPAENLQAVAEIVHDEYQRDIARSLTASASDDSFDDVIVPDYANEADVIVDCVTLDSLTCAPCQYMVDAVKKSCEAIGAKVRWSEHKITGRDGLGYMTKLGVTNIPSICIDGEVKFSSIIPDSATLRQAIEEKIQAKG